MTISEHISKLSRTGYTVSFKIIDSATLAPETNSLKTYTFKEITSFSIFECNQEKDPISNSIIVAIETIDGCKGILIDGVGNYSDERVSDFIGLIKIYTRKKKKNNCFRTLQTLIYSLLT